MAKKKSTSGYRIYVGGLNTIKSSLPGTFTPALIYTPPGVNKPNVGAWDPCFCPPEAGVKKSSVK